ncbi:MAG: C25 family cysteine peptidase, partial [Candidatus Aenigmarchaeota archaeon]|nr:C25 family cysteine peptidase [Candidatus Aenigmarchaeota archaeon]
MKWLILVFLALVIAFSGCTQRTVETTTTTSITTIFTTTTINEINTSGGFILTGEALKAVAEDVAKLKKWDVLIVNTSNPIEIRKQIVSFTEHKNYEYMLILGDDNIIPIEKDGILDKKYLPNEELQNALDELFYGNIDNDDFVELSVGRIPLNNKDQIMNY